MKSINKISGSFLLGLTVILLGIFTSAFSKVEKESSRFTGEIYVNTTATGDYEKLPSAGDYDDSNCMDTSPHACSWIRTNVPGSVPDEFDAVQAEALEQAGLIALNSEKTGIYP